LGELAEIIDDVSVVTMFIMLLLRL
jgi:hypothetical protein